MKAKWKKEIARDCLALGSIPFYFIVAVRAVIGKYMLFVYQMLISVVVLFILYRLIKNSNMHVARSFILVAFTSIFYNDVYYTIFASLLWMFIVLSAFYLKKKNKEIWLGVLFGAISFLTGYFIAPLL